MSLGSIVAGSAVSAGLSIIGGNQVNTELSKGYRDAMAQLAQISEYLAPYRELGQDALGLYRNLLGIGEDGQYDPDLAMKTLETRPGYQFGLQTGQKAIETGAAAKSSLMSGKTGKALMKFGQEYGQNFYNQEINRLGGAMNYGTNAINVLSGNAGVGAQMAMRNATNRAGVIGSVTGSLNNAIQGGITNAMKL